MPDVMNRARARVADLVGPPGAVPWDDPRAALGVAGGVLEAISADGELLPALVAGVSGPDRQGCESYPCMDKLVLWQSDDRRTRLRLHLFSPGYSDRPHNHRWSFASRILRGRYLQSIYGTEDVVLDAVRRRAQVRPLLAHDEGLGSHYFLEHSLVHSLRTDVLTVSLVLRGPAVKSEYFTLEGTRAAEAGPRLVLSTGSTRESADERASKSMTPARHAEVEAVLAAEGLA